jgi:multicomponent Na+:H+ antiporter subunit E
MFESVVMLPIIIYAVPIGLLWTLITNRFTLDAFAIGYLLGIVFLIAVGARTMRVSLRRLPAQCIAVLIYLVSLVRNIIVSAFDVARRVINPRLPLAAGILEVETRANDELIAALSAHSITITPGELVIDFAGNQHMYVHCLDVSASAETLPIAQTQRVVLFGRMLGRD